MAITQKLSLNKHPKDCDDLSIVKGLNIKSDRDMTCITNEESIRENTVIRDYLEQFFTGDVFTIVGVIPCNDELCILCIRNSEPNNGYIIRYRESNLSHEEGIKCVYDKWVYSGGKIKGTFTYNVENSLIIAIAEYGFDDDTEVPLKTINLGNYDDDNIPNDLNLPDGLLACCPEVRLPIVLNVNYTKGRSYKGWYYLFIRYKINSVDYTQWFPIGYPIYIDEIKEQNIIKYPHSNNYNDIYLLNFDKKDTSCVGKCLDSEIYKCDVAQGYIAGCSDAFSSDTDIANETIMLNLFFQQQSLENYKYFQLGFICVSKTYTKSWASYDINLLQNIQYLLTLSELSESDTQEMITTYSNYYNVQNIINYKNRLYVANYDDFSVVDNEKLQAIADKVTVKLVQREYTDEGLVYDNTLIYKDGENSSPNQYYSKDPHFIKLSDYYNVEDSRAIYISIVQNNQYYTDRAYSCYAGDVNIMACWWNSGAAYKCAPGSACLVGKDYNGNYFTFPNERYDQSTSYKVLVSIGQDSTILTSSNHYDCVNKWLELSTNIVAQGKGKLFFDTAKSFNERRLHSSLIPGEVYNFYIHFVDKYGGITRGYQIENTTKWKLSTNANENGVIAEDVIIYRLIYNGEGKYNTNDDVYYAIPASVTIRDIVECNNLSDLGITYCDVVYPDRNIIHKSNSSLGLDYSDFFIRIVKEFATEDLIDANISVIANSFIMDGTSSYPDIYINSEGKRLFKIPFPWLQFTQNKRDDSDTFTIPKSTSVTVDRYDNRMKYIVPIFNNVTIPDGYVGWFISYEKPEMIQQTTGFLTKSDFYSYKNINHLVEDCDTYQTKDSNSISRDGITEGNSNDSNEMLFFDSNFDIDDSLSLKYNGLRIEASNIFVDTRDTDVHLQPSKNYKYCHDWNKPIEKQFYPGSVVFPINDYELCVANSVEKKREYRGTALRILSNSYLFPSEDTNIGSTKTNEDPQYNQYLATLLLYRKDLYTKTDKTLIPITQQYYADTTDNVSVEGQNLPGYISWKGTLVYSNFGVLSDEQGYITAPLKSMGVYYTHWSGKDDGRYLVLYINALADKDRTYANVQPIAYMQYFQYSDQFFESKSINNAPENITITNVENKNQSNAYGVSLGTMVNPANSIDLFQNSQFPLSETYLKTYDAYRENLINSKLYNKTIRRSNVIQDESRQNAWRYFGLENYKSIIENKGIITNLVGIGTYLLVHTEHSLFLFDTENVLKTQDTNVQLQQQDIFDIDYKEVFTSGLGYGGLQDDKAYTVDQYGYVYYNNDFNRFYRFDQGKLETIDTEIIQWLHKYKPYNVRFGHDRDNNRILVKMNFFTGENTLTEKELVLSYNYDLTNWISMHSYHFDETFSTKANLYMQCIDEHENCSFHQFIKDGSSYGSFDNIKGSFGEQIICPSILGIIANKEYAITKYIDYFTYKLNKFVDAEETTGDDYIYSPVEKHSKPFSGNQLVVYNGDCSTGNLDINIDEETDKNVFCNYFKPYWELNNWNFSYLRNKISEYDKYGDGFEMSRLYGNYFVIEFTFTNEDGRKIEFEDLNYRIIK